MQRIITVCASASLSLVLGLAAWTQEIPKVPEIPKAPAKPDVSGRPGAAGKAVPKLPAVPDAKIVPGDLAEQRTKALRVIEERYQKRLEKLHQAMGKGELQPHEMQEKLAKLDERRAKECARVEQEHAARGGAPSHRADGTQAHDAGMQGRMQKLDADRDRKLLAIDAKFEQHLTALDRQMREGKLRPDQFETKRIQLDKQRHEERARVERTAEEQRARLLASPHHGGRHPSASHGGQIGAPKNPVRDPELEMAKEARDRELQALDAEFHQRLQKAQMEAAQAGTPEKFHAKEEKLRAKLEKKRAEIRAKFERKRAEIVRKRALPGAGKPKRVPGKKATEKAALDAVRKEMGGMNQKVRD